MQSSADDSAMLQSIIAGIVSSLRTQSAKVEGLKVQIVGLDDALDRLARDGYGRCSNSREAAFASTLNGAMRDNLDKMAQSLSLLQSENDGVRKELNESEDDLSEVQRMIRLVEAQGAKLRELNAEIQSYEANIKTLRSSFASPSTTEPKKNSKPFDLQCVLDSIKNNFNALSVDHREVKRECTSSHGQNERLRTELENSRRAELKFERAQSATAKETDVLKQKLKETEQRVRRGDDEQRALQRRVCELEGAVRESEKEKGRLRAAQSAMEQQSERREREREGAQSAVRELQSRLSEFQSDRVRLIARVKNGERVQSLLKRQVEAFENETASQQHKIAMLTELHKVSCQQNNSKRFSFQSHTENQQTAADDDERIKLELSRLTRARSSNVDASTGGRRSSIM